VKSEGKNINNDPKLPETKVKNSNFALIQKILMLISDQNASIVVNYHLKQRMIDLTRRGYDSSVASIGV